MWVQIGTSSDLVLGEKMPFHTLGSHVTVGYFEVAVKSENFVGNFVVHICGTKDHMVSSPPY